MRTLTFASGELIFREGDFDLTMFDIQKGSVGIYLDYGTELEKKLTVLGENQFLGEMGLIEASPRSATAVAEADGTTLYEITEDELGGYFKDKPEKLLRIMRQMSARIRENTEKYASACKALRENEEAVQAGAGKSEELTRKLDGICKEAERYGAYRPGQRSSFFTYVEADLAEYGTDRKIVKANFLERLTTKYIDPDDMHANPDDEFCQPSVGPNDRIINEYVRSIPIHIRFDEPVFPEPVIVYKMAPKGYMILNGHHRWAAALKSGLSKLRASVINPRTEGELHTQK